jgi:predicted lipoprotein
MPEQTRAHALAVAYADDALAHAKQARQQLGTGDDFAQRFSRAGQESINVLVNQMIGTLETAAARRLDQVLATHQNGTLRTKDVQGAPSGLSTEIPRVWLNTTKRLYTGTDGQGLGSLVRAAAPAIDASLRAAFERVSAAFKHLTAPLERVAAEDCPALTAAVRATKELEAALRVELVSALKVTLTFVATDGD